MNIAIVRLTSLGDIILAMPVVQIIRRKLPNCNITWVADNRFADILDHHPDIRHIARIDLKKLKRYPSLPAVSNEYRILAAHGPFDTVIDLHGMIKSAVIAAILGGKKYGFSRNMRKEALAGLFYNQTFPVSLELPAVCRYATLATRSLGLDFQPGDLTSLQPFLFWSSEDGIAVDSYFSRECRNIIFIPETSADYKNYPPEKFARIANMLGENILLCHGNQKEFNTASKIADLSSNVRVLPRLTLNQLKATIGRADLVIGGDSGPTHIAWACGTPSITLFGATPVCICPTPRNRVINTSSPVNLRRYDTSDMSIREIPEETILLQAQELLNAP